MEDNDKVISDLRSCEKTLRDMFTCIEGERDNLLGMIKNIKKESLTLEVSNNLLESRILKLKDDLRDSSSVGSDGTDFHDSNAS